MSEDVIDIARTQVRNLLGEALAAKATDAFCLALTAPQPASLSILEAVAGPPSVPPAIVEFAPRQEVVNAVKDLGNTLRRSAAWNTVRSGLHSGLGQSYTGTSQLHHLLRQARLIPVRDDFYRVSGAVWREIERRATVLPQRRLEFVAGPSAPLVMTQVCWLNRTIRARVDPRVLAAVVDDPEIKQVDLPRRLTEEIDVSGRTVGVVQFRERSGRTGAGITVAVIDKEVHHLHPSFQDRVILKENFTQEPWGSPSDHGTAVAGIIAANGDLVAMAPGATIYSYKVLATNSTANGDDFDGALAIQRALEDGAHVANCSWGAGPGDGTSREARACNTAWALGLTIVKSAGNRGPGAGTLTTPADADGVIVVGATEREGTAVQDYSSRGPTPTGKERPHLLAPGGSVAVGVNSCLVSGGFGDTGHGTSYAAPHVSGLIALLLEGDPDLTPDELRTQLIGLCTLRAEGDGNIQRAGLVSLDGLQ